MQIVSYTVTNDYGDTVKFSLNDEELPSKLSITTRSLEGNKVTVVLDMKHLRSLRAFIDMVTYYFDGKEEQDECF